MPRAPRDLQPGFCSHVTVCCNNREFRPRWRTCREVLLDAIKRGLEKSGFKLSARLALGATMCTLC